MSPGRPLALLALTAVCACGGGAPPSPGFASMAGVLGCARTVVWAEVERVRPGGGGLEVALDAQEWVHPADGPAQLTVVADDPAREVGAPAWRPGPVRLLVVVPHDGPVQPYGADEGARAVRQWRDAGEPRPSARECGRA